MRAEAGKFITTRYHPRAIDDIEHYLFSGFSPNIVRPCLSPFSIVSYLLSTFFCFAILLHVTLLLFVIRVEPLNCALTFGFLALDLGTDLFFGLCDVSRASICRVVRSQSNVDKLHHQRFLPVKLSVSD
jgi:hypothetical protein